MLPFGLAQLAELEQTTGLPHASPRSTSTGVPIPVS
jgi:hypothetical protein